MIRESRECGPAFAAGFTLIELLTVMAIIGVLVSLLSSALVQARSSARRVQCQHRLRQLAIAANHYHSARQSFPPGLEQRTFEQAPVYRGTSLFAFLLPYLENPNVVRHWNAADPLKNALGGTASVTAAVLPELLCPDDQILRNPVSRGQWTHGLTSYAGNGGSISYPPNNAAVDGVFHSTGPASDPKPNQSPVSIAKIVDGTSKTLLICERYHADLGYNVFIESGRTSESLGAWGWWGPAAGRKAIGHVTVSAEAGLNFVVPTNVPDGEISGMLDRRLSAMGSGHAGGANTSFCDGSVGFLTDDISIGILQSMATRAKADAP